MQRKIDLGEDRNLVQKQTGPKKPQASFLMEELPKSLDATLDEARQQSWPYWLNSEPLIQAHVDDEGKAFLFYISDVLKNKVVLLEIWDYTLLPCMRSLSYVKEWDKRYRPAGLITIGVHAPRFDFGKDKVNLMEAIRDLGISFPVVMDNNFAIWRSLENRYWPRRILLSPENKIRYDHVGEGDYEECEKNIQLLLRDVSPGLACPRVMKPVRKSDELGYIEEHTTPEIFFGMNSNVILGNKEFVKFDGEEVKFIDNSTGEYPPELLYLDGSWIVQKHSIYASPNDKGDGKLTINFKGTDVYLVARSRAKNPADVDQMTKIQILINGKHVSEDFLGSDAQLNELRRSSATIRDPKLYHLLSKLDSKEHELTIIFEKSGPDVIELYGLFFSHGN